MKSRKKKSRLRIALQWIGWVALVQVVLINISAAMYAYKATHLYERPDDSARAGQENIFSKTWRLFTGLRMYRSAETEVPTVPYTAIRLPVEKEVALEAFYIKKDSVASGTVILFHGLAGNKSMLLQISNEFRYWGYNVLLVDARGHGNSTGNYTTIGYREAADVKVAYEYIQKLGEKNIILWGASMGAVEIAKAISDYALAPSAVILEMPFGSLQSFMKRKGRSIGFPAQPFGFLTTFWISIERGINGYQFRCIDYAKKIHCPVLLQGGDHDYLVPLEDTYAIYQAIPTADKKLVIYEHTDHEFYLKKNPAKWRKEMETFLHIKSK